MFRFTDQSPVTFNDPQPEAVDVVVVGGGVIGISTAWYLRQRGLSVLVCEKGRVAGEQSSRNWGWVRVTGRDPDEVPIAIDSQACWKAISAELDEDTGFRQEGLLALAETEQEMAGFQQWVNLAQQHRFDTQLLTREQLAKHIDISVGNWCGGMLSPGDCRAEPFLAVPAIARGVQAQGGLIRENCAVRSIDREAGVVAGVITEQGRVRTQSVVCAAGAWSSLLLSNLGITLPQLVVRATVARSAPAPEIYSGTAALKDVFLRRRLDGGYTLATGFTEHTIGANSFRYLRQFLSSTGSASDIGYRLGGDATQRPWLAGDWREDEPSPFEKTRVLDPSPSARGLKKIRRNLARRVPELAGIEIAESWAGMIDATPDIVPVMDEISTLPGLYLATGFSGHGFGIGPGAGQVMASMVAGEPATHDLSRFRFARFSDGSKMRPGPAL